MDIRLGEAGADGIDVAEKIRARFQIPVVYLTAYADDETVRRASRTEPFGYILKPFDDVQLRTVIEMALYKHAAERKLRESERRYVATLSSIGDAVIATDAEARVTFMNPIAENLTGWTRADAMGRLLKEVFVIVNEDTREPVEDPAEKVLRLGTIVGLANHTVLLSRDGRELPIDDSGAPIVDDHGDVTGTVLVFRDVSERHLVEETLRKAEDEIAKVSRLTTMGELAASIAHEVNQPLMAIVTNAGTMLRHLEEARKAGERIARDGHRAGDVVRSVRNLVSRTETIPETLSLNDLVGEIGMILRGELRRKNVTLETDLAPDLREVEAHRVQLQQVVLNLAMNAIEAAVRSGGSAHVVKITTANAEGGARLSVEDSGPGIAEESAGRIFDAFYSTKEDGMGMGLAICRSIVEAHGGTISHRRQDDRTVFDVALPRADL
jgi:PAS domain S-box-containing protein